MKDQPTGLCFADAADVPIPYMQRTRDYYLALGYGNPYRWAHHNDSPFTPLNGGSLYLGREYQA